MSGGGGGLTGNSYLDMGVMVGASILAPELAPEFLTAEEGGLGLSAAQAAGVTGSALGGGLSALSGGNVAQGMIAGGIGGYGAGGGFSNMFSGSTPTVDPTTSLTSATPPTPGPQVAGTSAFTPTETAVGTGTPITSGLPQGGGLTPQMVQAGEGVQGIGPNLAGTTGANIPPGYTPSATPPTGTGWFGSMSPLQKAATVGGGALGLNYLFQQDAKKYGVPTSATTPYTGGNLSKFHYDPATYSPDVVRPPSPVYKASYADGGLLQGGPANIDFMGNDMYPQSQQTSAAYAIPNQMPTSAQQTAASYEPRTNPLTGEMTANMNGGGTGADAIKNLMGSRDAIDKYTSQYAEEGGPAAVAAKAQGGDYNAMLVLNKLRGTHGANYAGGGIANLGGYSDGGQMLKGPGDGMSDSIPATIQGKQPARLANNEFVVPSDVVSHLGNGSSDAGAKKLYAMMDKVRRARTGKQKQAPKINADKFMPA